MWDVLIVGAGPAGLTAGYILTRDSDLSVKVVEADAVYVGGISRTEHYKGYSFDIGGHRFFSMSEDVENLWKEILPDDFIERPRSSRIFYKNKFYSYPLDAKQALTNLGLWESVLCVASYAKARLFPANQPRTFHQWVSNQFGERLFSIFFKTYTEKVWGMSCDDISADWAAQRIKGLSLFKAVVGGLKKSFGLKPRGPVVKTLIESFRYPRRGPGMMWEMAAKKFELQGGSIDMGGFVKSFSLNKQSGVWDIVATFGDEERLFQARHVISSAPLRDVVQHVSPIPKSASRAKDLKYRDFLTVALMLNQPASFEDNWIYIHDPSVKVGRVQNFASWSPEMVPDVEASGCLGLEYFCFEGDQLWETSDAELVELAIDEMEKIGLASRSEVTEGRVVRQPKAYPVYDDEYKKIVDEIRADFLDNYPHFHFVGRNGMHKYNNQDHAMMTAMLTAKNIIANEQKFDVWRVNEDAEYHEGEVRSAGASGERLVPRKAV